MKLKTCYISSKSIFIWKQKNIDKKYSLYINNKLFKKKMNVKL
jgi:hypothetical protein